MEQVWQFGRVGRAREVVRVVEAFFHKGVLLLDPALSYFKETDPERTEGGCRLRNLCLTNLSFLREPEWEILRPN